MFRRWHAIVLAVVTAVFAAAALPVCADDGAAAGASLSCVHEIPYVPFAGLILVPVTVNGSPPLHFVLDSGATQSAINDPHLATALGLEAEDVGLARGMGSGATWVLIADDVGISSGGVEILRTSLVVHDIGERLAEMAGREIDGFLGGDLFARYVVEIDPGSRRLLLHDPAVYDHRGTGQRLTLEVVDSRPVIEGMVVIEEGAKPIPVRLAADTGSSRSLTLITKSKRRLKPRDEQRLGASIGVVGETLLVKSPIHSLDLGRITIRSVDTAWAEAFRVPAVRNIPKLNGILGNQILRRFRVIFDYPGGAMVLEPPFGSSDAVNENSD